MRRTVITEDIISRALNESIDEFMLEEGWKDGFNKWWNKPYMQKIRNGFNKAGKWLNNAASIYMDEKTNGKWNRQYGSYADANSRNGELHYLKKWLEFYNEELNNIIYQRNPSQRDEYETWERDADNPNREYKKVRKNDYVGVDGAIAYAQRFCVFQNFNDYVRNISPERENVKLINTYIFNYITKPAKNRDLKTVLSNLRIGSFYSSSVGQEYLKMNRNEQQSQQKNIRKTWNERKAKQQTQQNQQQSQQPTPNNNGKFTYNANALDYGTGPYSTWKISKDTNGKNILVNPQDPTKAVFY